MLRTLMIRKKLDEKRRDLEALRAKEAELQTREAELVEALKEVNEETPEEERTALETMVEEHDAEAAENKEAITNLDEEVRNLENELTEIENAQEPEPEDEPKAPAAPEERKDTRVMARRSFYGMNTREQAEFIGREDVQGFLAETRTAIKERRSITNVGLTIPEVMLGLIRENIMEYSKLYKHVNVRAINGDGRLVVMGTIPEAVWTDCCANLNELELGFADVEVECWKVGGFFAVCNANLEDSDIDLAAELLTAIGQSIGLALDKAILYGTGTRMPQGIVSSLAQDTKPADWPETAREWVDLHETNIVAIDTAGMTAVEAFAAVVEAFGAAKGKYSRGEKVFVMNEKTYTALAAKAVSVDAAGNIVTGVFDRMPIIGGIIEVLDFIQDDVIIGGYFDLYLLAERAGQRFATSEHFRFLQDQTVMKGTARYDGQPVIREAFVAIGINNTTPTADMTFAPDDANPEESE